MNSFFRRFKSFGMRTKAILIVALILVLVGTGTLFVFIQTGKLGIFAASPIKTVIVTGKYTNATTGKAVVGAKISIESPFNFFEPVVVKTDGYGKYKGTLTAVDTSDPQEKIISIRQYMPNYPQTGKGTEFDRITPNSTSSTVTITQNFKLAPVPKDIVSTTQLDAVSQRCRTNQNTYDYSGDGYWYHTGDYQGQVINDVLFCTAVANKGYFSTYSDDIAKVSLQIKSLIKQTSLPFIPNVYLTGPLVWTPGAAAYSQKGSREIVEDVKGLNNLAIITHEFGHLVDWWKGPDKPVGDNSCDNIVDKNRTKSHCMFSSSRKDFVNAASIAGISEGFIIDYAASDRVEMFAEMFSSLLTPDSINSVNFTKRQTAQYSITNALLGDYDSDLGGGSYFSLSTNPAGQNAGMYVYKFVASAGNLDEYFPGTLGGWWSYNEIWYGKYMTTGVVSVRVKKCGNFSDWTETTDFSIGGVNATTRIKQTSGVFPANNTGDLFDTTGTAVLMDVPTGDQSISIPGFASEKLDPSSVSIVSGANQVDTMANGKLGFNYSNQFGSFGTGNGQFASLEDIAIDPTSGNVFAVDKIGWGPGQSRVEVFDKTGKYLSQFGQSNLSDASRITVNKNGDVFVLSNIGGVFKVIVFKNNGTYSATISLSYGARDIATDPATGELYVLVGSGKSVYVYTSNSYFRAFNIQYRANRIAINASHDIFASDVINKVVRSYDTFGNYWNEQIGPFQSVADLAIDSSNRIYVLDSISKNVQVFSSDRSLLTKFSFSDQEAIPVDLAIGSDGRVSVGYSNLETP